jgi:hypothetical protein
MSGKPELKLKFIHLHSLYIFGYATLPHLGTPNNHQPSLSASFLSGLAFHSY